MTTAISTEPATPRTDWPATARDLGPGFAARAGAYDANDSFPFDNYHELKEQRVFSAAIPAELGGGGAPYPEVCAMLRELGRHCGATALSLAMHTHLVAANVWLSRHGAPVAPLLQRIAAEQLVLVTSSASDWLESNGTAERVEGGYRITAHKHFCSGSPAGNLLSTTGLYDDPNDGPTVLHFAVSMKAEGVTILDNWRTMGMRASGSNDVVLDGVFVPDGAIPSRRPKGAWVPFLDVVTAVALPPILSVYLGIAEAARDLALGQVAKKQDDPGLCYQVGEMDTALTAGRLAVESAVELCGDLSFTPGVETTNALLIRKTIAADALLLAVEMAMDVVGGGGFFRGIGLERLVRDMHAIRFHPLQAKRQHRFTGRAALGFDPVG